jgi:hypothetical protein
LSTTTLSASATSAPHHTNTPEQHIARDNPYHSGPAERSTGRNTRDYSPGLAPAPFRPSARPRPIGARLVRRRRRCQRRGSLPAIPRVSIGVLASELLCWVRSGGEDRWDSRWKKEWRRESGLSCVYMCGLPALEERGRSDNALWGFVICQLLCDGTDKPTYNEPLRDKAQHKATAFTTSFVSCSSLSRPLVSSSTAAEPFNVLTRSLTLNLNHVVTSTYVAQEETSAWFFPEFHCLSIKPPNK